MSEERIVLVIAATSDIGRATALVYGRKGWRVLLAGRDLEQTLRNAQDISARCDREAAAFELDVLKSQSIDTFVSSLPVLPDTVVCAVGELGDQSSSETDLQRAATVLRSNFEAPALVLALFARKFSERGHGTIVGVSSVAGERGRASNYIYGSAKAGFTAFLSGLRARYFAAGVRVVTVKPGFVRTRMTEGLQLPPVITAEAQEVAEAIYRAAEERKRDIIYVRRVWRPIMALIRFLPESLFKRLPL